MFGFVLAQFGIGIRFGSNSFHIVVVKKKVEFYAGSSTFVLILRNTCSFKNSETSLRIGLEC